MNAAIRRFAIPICFAAQFAVGARCATAADVDLLDHFWRVSHADSELPGFVLRMDLDVTNDRLPELFLANSRKSGSSGVQEWIVYSPIGERRYRVLGVLSFSYRLFRLTEGPRLVTYHRKTGPAGEVVTFRVTESGFQEESAKDSAADNQSEFESWRREVGLKVLTAPLKQLSGGRTLPTWLDLLMNQPVPNTSSLENLVVVE